MPTLALAGVDLTVQVEGVKGSLLTNVRAYLSIYQRRAEDSLTTRWVQILHSDAEDEIRAALEPFGYYSPVIRESLTESDGAWIARYEIEPGPETRIAVIDVAYVGDGGDDPDLGAALRAFPLKVGDVLDHQRYEAAKAQLITAAADLGYAKADTGEARVVVDPGRNSASIALQVATGPRYYFGKVSFEQDFLEEELLERTVTLREGDIYLDREVIAFQQGLQVSDWASVVAVDARFDEAVDGRVPLVVRLQPSKRNRYALGVGYETDVGLRLSARWINRRINRKGHHSEVFMRLSSVRRTLRGDYFIPVIRPITDRLALSAEYEYEQTSDTERNTLNGEVAFIRRSLDERNFYKGFLELRAEDYEVRGESPVRTRLLSLGVARRFVKSEAGLFPQRGHVVDGELRGASSAVFSDTSYARARLGTRFLLPLGTNGRALVSGEFGAAVVEDFELYPTSLRFFAGGDSSIRGYQYKSLGPFDANGNVVGGRNLVVVNGEYDHRVLERWVVAGFVDAGNAFNDTLDHIYVGSGVGFRWLSEFGSLRIDLAWPVSEPDLELGDVFFHLGFGAPL